MAIASGPLFNKFTLPHSQIPQFTSSCLVIAPEKTVNEPLVPYYVNMSIDSQFTNDLLDPNSASYFRLRFRIEKFITDSLQADGLEAENFQLLSLSPGSVVSISGISLRKIGLEQNILDALIKGNTDFLAVIKDRIFVSSSLSNSSTSTSTTINATEFVNSTTTLINTTTTTTMNIVNTTKPIMVNTTQQPEINTTTIKIDYFAVDFKINKSFTEQLKNTSSDEYASFVTQLDSFVKLNFKLIYLIF